MSLKTVIMRKKIVKIKNFHGIPKLTDFEIIEEEISTELKDGEILAEAEWLSVDPYMRGNYVDPVKIGDTMKGCQVARVIKSLCDEFPEGSQVVGNFGWQDFTVYKPDPDELRYFLTIVAMPDMKGLPDSYALGCMGMPGNAAYHGVHLLEPKAEETLVVSTAAGAVGSLACQIGKIKACKVLGFTGSDEKVRWLVDELGIDHAFNYKTVSTEEKLSKYTSEGIDMYFDNVGGELASHVVKHMKPRGRICQCGCIATYNKCNSAYTDLSEMPEYEEKNLQIRPLSSMEYAKSWFEGIYQIRDWILEGKIKIRETVVEGLENMPQAFINLFEGKNIGKVVVKL